MMSLCRGREFSSMKEIVKIDDRDDLATLQFHSIDLAPQNVEKTMKLIIKLFPLPESVRNVEESNVYCSFCYS
jgi:hypothetical protein